MCMIKIFRGGGQGGDTFKNHSLYEQLLPLPTPCFKMFLERSLADPPPHFKDASLLPSPHPPSLPPKSLIIHYISRHFRKDTIIYLLLHSKILSWGKNSGGSDLMENIKISQKVKILQELLN